MSRGTSFHVVESDASGVVTNISPNAKSSRINCGYFVLKREMFDHMERGDELVVEPFYHLTDKKQLVTYECDGFWEWMDTFKDKQQLDDMYARGDTP